MLARLKPVVLLKPKQLTRSFLTHDLLVSLPTRSEGPDMSRLGLSRAQRLALQRQLRVATDARVYRRTLALLEVARGRSVSEVAAMLGVARQSVHNWIVAYRHHPEPATLHDAHRDGRPPALEDDSEALLGSLLDGSPQDFGHPNTGWTVPLLRREIESRAGLAVSDHTVRRALVRLGYAWKRPRYVLAPDPERDKKTADSPANLGPAATQRGVGRGRD
jgi:transposase